MHDAVVFYLLLTAVLLALFTVVVALQSLPRLVARVRDLVRPQRSPVVVGEAPAPVSQPRLAA